MVKKKVSKDSLKKAKIGRIIGTIVIIVLLSFLSMIVAGVLSIVFIGNSVSSDIDTTGNVALIKINGPIVTSSDESIFASAEGVSADSVVKRLDSISKDPTIKAVILEINSGGGSGVAADEIGYAIEKLSDKNITVVSYVRDIGASAAYWIASESDYIIANKLSFVGSIGVLSGFIEISGLMDDYNVSYERFVAGKYKDFGTPLRPVTSEERKLFQAKLDAMHKVFIEEVAYNRNVSFEEIEKIATGMIYTANEALKYNLIDEIGYMDNVIEYLEEKENITVDIKEYSSKKSLFNILMQSANNAHYNTGRGIGDSLVDNSMNQKVAIW